MVSQLLSCEDLDHVSYAKSLAAIQGEPSSCFQFVNNVLEHSAPCAYQKLLENHAILLKRIPEEHQAPHFIPYYYSLLPFEHLKYWEKIEVMNVQVGDLFIYIDRDYNPDPTTRVENAPSVTHVAIVDSVLKNKDVGNIELKLVDSSSRIRGRRCCYKEIAPVKRGSIAYSFLDMLLESTTGLWNIKFISQKLLTNKYIHVLRIKNT
jgi:hypothetical protein